TSKRGRNNSTACCSLCPAKTEFYDFEFDLTKLSMLEGKQGIIFGVANKRSIACATAQALHQAGARLAFGYQGERVKESVERLTAEDMLESLLVSCDVANHVE